jgi:agmatinase
LIDLKKSLQVGFSTAYNETGHGFNVLDAPRANDISAKQITSFIKEKVQTMPVYLTFDIDCLDPAFAPGTGIPVCGGLSTDKILCRLTGINIIGMDVVEVGPAYDNSEITALAAATIAVELLHFWTIKNKQILPY